jgi:hypothetical protein
MKTLPEWKELRERIYRHQCHTSLITNTAVRTIRTAVKKIRTHVRKTNRLEWRSALTLALSIATRSRVIDSTIAPPPPWIGSQTPLIRDRACFPNLNGT